MLNYYDFVREEENKARRLTTLQNVNKTRNESDGINPSRVSHACSPSLSLCRSLLGTLSRLVLSEFAWPLGSAFCLLFFFIDFLKGTQNANNNNNSTDEQRQQQQQDEHYEHIGHYYSVSFYY